jgi:hypothetical protein
MSITKLSTSSIKSGSKNSEFWDGRANVGIASRSLGTFSTTSSNPFGNWEYFQGMGCGFPSANVTLVCGSYNSNYTTNGNCYTIGNGGTGWTSRTSYPTSIFQSEMVAYQGKVFVFGGNGLNGTAGGGAASATRYMTTSLNSWTSGTSMPASGSWGAWLTPNYILVAKDGNWYRGTGTGAWTSITAPPALNSYSAGTMAYCFGGTNTWNSTDDGTTWLKMNIAPPLTASPNAIVAPTDGNAATAIYLFYNTRTTPVGYYFNGNSYTSTTNYGTEIDAPGPGGGNGNTQYARGINGNQITLIMGNGGYRYATINA